MRELFDSLFSLRKLSAADESVTLEFARSMPLWGWIGVVLALGLFACWSYSRLLGPRWARYALGTVRTLALVLVALIIAEPRLVKQSERIEKDWVVVMVDRSASLGVPVASLDDVKWLDLTIDADEFDPNLALIKGGGAALLQEKIVATASDQMIVIADARRKSPSSAPSRCPWKSSPSAGRPPRP